MLNLAQQYQAAADSLVLDCEAYGHMGPRARSYHHILPQVERLVGSLLGPQLTLMYHTVGSNQQGPPASQNVLRTVYTSSELPTAAMQTLAAACVDMQAKYKAKAREQQRLKRKKHKQQQQSQSQQLGAAVNRMLLELVVPGDHAELELLPGWKAGVGAITFPDIQISPEAYVCTCAEVAIRLHLEKVCSAGEEVEEQQLQRLACTQSPVCCLDGMKLLLEAALLLQGVEPEAGAHHELQVLVNRVIFLAPKEDVVALLRERGGLIMQAVRVTEPEEWSWGIAGEAIPWREREVNWAGLGHGEAVWFDWMRTVNAIAMRLGKLLQVSGAKSSVAVGGYFQSKKSGKPLMSSLIVLIGLWGYQPWLGGQDMEVCGRYVQHVPDCNRFKQQPCEGC